MGQQPQRSPAHTGETQLRNMTDSAPALDDDVQLKQILDDLRAMGERLSIATRKQIEDIKLRGSDATGPDPAAQRPSPRKEAMATVSSEVDEQHQHQHQQDQHKTSTKTSTRNQTYATVIHQNPDRESRSVAYPSCSSLVYGLAGKRVHDPNYAVTDQPNAFLAHDIS